VCTVGSASTVGPRQDELLMEVEMNRGTYSGGATPDDVVKKAANGCLHKPQDMTGGMSNDDSDGSEVEQRSCKGPGGKKEVDELGHPPDC